MAGLNLITRTQNAFKGFMINPAKYTNSQFASYLNYVKSISVNSGIFDYKNNDSGINAYTNCPPLASIIDSITDLILNGKKTLSGKYGQSLNTTESRSIEKLLTEPNNLQNYSQFITQLVTNIQLNGYAVILPIYYNSETISSNKPEVPGDLPLSLWIAPLQEVEVVSKIANTIGNNIAGVYICGKFFAYDDIWLITSGKVSNDNYGIPTQPICSLSKPINNIMLAMQSEGKLLAQRGPSGIISQEYNAALGAVIPMKAEDKQELQNGFNAAYGFVDSQSHVMITNAAVKYQKTGFNYAELGLNESIVLNTKLIADFYHYPTELLSIVNPTYSNAEAADKRAYTKCAIPLANNIFEQLNAYLLAGKATNLTIDFNHIPELQENKVNSERHKKLLMERLKLEWESDLITRDQFLIQLGYEPMPNNEGNYRISQIIKTNTPLATTLGVGGTESLVSILQSTISEDAKIAALELLFGFSNEDAKRLSKK